MLRHPIVVHFPIAGAGLAAPTLHGGGEMALRDEPPADPASRRYPDRDDDLA